MAALSALWPRVRLWLVLLAALYAVLVLIAWILQRRMIYFPDTRSVPLPGEYGQHGLREVTLRTEDGVALQAWYWPGARAGTVLFFHGNAGNRGDRAGYLRALHALGYGVLLPDYRGYGGSEGTPSEEGFYRDAEACLAWVRANAPGPTVYLGSSIGSGVACELAQRAPPAGLILQSGFSSLVDVARSAYPILPVGWLLRDRYENEAKIRDCACPLLVVHGDADRIAPMKHARRVFEAAREPKAWLEVPGAGHNDLVAVGGAVYWDAVRTFLDAHLGGTQSQAGR